MTPDPRLSAAPRRAVRGTTVVLASGLLLILTGCISRAPAADPEVAPTTPQGPWFCEPAIGEDGWRCVDTPTLVANPRPSRPLARALAEADTRRAASAAPEAGAATDPAIDSDISSDTDSAVAGSSNNGRTLIEIGDSSMTTAVVRKSAAETADSSESADGAEPADEPVSMLALPPEFYVVQLAALSSPEQLQTVFEEFSDRSLSAVTVEADGALRYALLLGVFETFAAAEQAAANVPNTATRFEPWIRRLGTLQAAMLRAEQQRDE